MTVAAAVYTSLVYHRIQPRKQNEKHHLSADADLIEEARARARRENTTLNAQFRIWLEDYTRRKQRADEAMSVIRELRGYVRTGGQKFTREEMNER